MKRWLVGMILMTVVGCNYSVDKPGMGAGGNPARAPEGSAGNGGSGNGGSGNGGSGNGGSGNGGSGNGGGGAAGTLDTRLSFANVLAVAIRTNCFGCHAAPRNAGGVNLETYETAFAARNEVADAVSSKYMPESKGRVMPDDQRALLLEWIAAGAPRDGVPVPAAGSAPPAAPAPGSKTAPDVTPAPTATPKDCGSKHDDDDDCDSDNDRTKIEQEIV